MTYPNDWKEGINEGQPQTLLVVFNSAWDNKNLPQSMVLTHEILGCLEAMM